MALDDAAFTTLASLASIAKTTYTEAPEWLDKKKKLEEEKKAAEDKKAGKKCKADDENKDVDHKAEASLDLPVTSGSTDNRFAGLFLLKKVDATLESRKED
jgi:hypothetical protein